MERLNKYLVCTLCDGYFREAHTVPECLHTFCKECLFAEFHRGARTCPTCGTALGLNAESKVVYDRNLQSCVDKLFPEFVAREQGEISCTTLLPNPLSPNPTHDSSQSDYEFTIRCPPSRRTLLLHKTRCIIIRKLRPQNLLLHSTTL